MVDDLLPHSRKAERAVLGALLTDPDALVRVTPILRPEDFYSEAHRIVFEAMCQNSGSPFDFVIVLDRLEQAGKMKAIGGPGYLGGLYNAVPTSLHAEFYAKRVADAAVRRRLIDVAARIAQHAYSENGDDPLSYAHKELMAVGQGRTAGTVMAADVASSLFEQVEYWANNPLPFGQVRGLSSGIRSFDKLTMGMQPKDLVMVMARPRVGKSALTLDVARRVGLAGGRVFIWAGEMSNNAIFMRWACGMSGVESKYIKRGLAPEDHKGDPNYYATSDQLAQFLTAQAKLSEMPYLAINDVPGLSAADIRAQAMVKAQHFGGLELVIVDHCGLINGQSAGGENSAKTEGRKSRNMKELAKELNCPVVLVVQMNRSVLARSNKRPNLGDLRDSGEHEENADMVFGLYREALYDDRIEAGSPKDLTMEIVSLKHRDGPSDVAAEVRYERSITRFTEWAH